MQPVRVKAYGLVYLTKRTYLVIQGFGLVFLLTLLVFCLVAPRPLAWEAVNPSVTWMMDYGPWIIGVVLVLEMIETTFMLLRFAEKEAEQNARAPDEGPAGWNTNR